MEIYDDVSRSKGKKYADENRSLYENCRGTNWSTWRKKAQESWEFSLGDQLSAEELNALQDAGMPTFDSNAITPAVETLQYFMTANNPKFFASGTEGSDDDKSYEANALIENSMRVSNFKSIHGNAIRGAMGKGLDFIGVDIDPNADNGLGEVIFKYIDSFDTFVDPASRDILFRDASYMLFKKDLIRQQLINLLPEFKERIRKASATDEHSVSYSVRDVPTSNAVFPEDIITPAWAFQGASSNKEDQEDFVDYYERYSKIRKKWYRLRIADVPTEEEQEQLLQQLQTQMQEIDHNAEVAFTDYKITMDDQLNEGAISQDRHDFELQRIQEEIMNNAAAQKQQLINGLLELQNRYTETVVSSEEFELMKDNPVFRDRILSALDYWATVIEVICSVGDTFLYKKTIPISEYPFVPIPYIHTGTPYPISAVRLVVGKQQEANKAHQLMIHNAQLGNNVGYWARHGSIVDIQDEEENGTVPGHISYYQGDNPPIPKTPLNLSNAFFGVVENSRREIEELLGASSLTQGKSDLSNVPYRGMIAQDEFGTRRIRAWGTNVVEPALEHLGKVYMQLAKLVYTSEKIVRLVNPETQTAESIIFNQRNIDGSILNSIDSISDDLRIIAGSTLPTNKYTRLEMMRQLKAEGIVDDIAVLENTDIPKKAEIVQRNSLYARMQQQLAAMEEEIKSLKGTNQTLERQIVQAGMREKIQQAGLGLEKADIQYSSGMDTLFAEQKAALETELNKFFTRMKAIEDEARNKAKEVPKKQ